MARSSRSRRSSSVGNANSSASGATVARLQPESANPNSTKPEKQADNVANRMANTLRNEKRGGPAGAGRKQPVENHRMAGDPNLCARHLEYKEYPFANR